MEPALDNRYETQYSKGVDADQLEADLRAVIEGEVRFEDGDKALYATDSSNYRQEPIGVVIPKNRDDIIKATAICKKHNAPLMPRGGGTSLAGQCCNVAVVMDMSKYYNQVLNIDKENKRVTVQPGLVLDEMRKATREEAGLTFGPDPATHDHCVIGGMLGNNSCGVHSVRAKHYGYGARMSDNTHSMTILTYDGEIMEVGPTSDEEFREIISAGGRKGEIYKNLKELRDKYADEIRKKTPDIPRLVSGYDLEALLPENNFNVARALVGSEGTCVTILEATMKLMPEPKERAVVVIGYESISEAGRRVDEIMKYKPIGLEGFDHRLVEYSKRKGLNTGYFSLLPENSKGWLLVEFGGDSEEEVNKKAQHFIDDMEEQNNHTGINLLENSEEQEHIWKIREAGLAATAMVPGEPYRVPGWEDSAVSPGKLGDYLKDLEELFGKYDYHPSLYGHFGQGCIHCRVAFDLFTEVGLKNYKDFTVEASHLVVKYGGSLSGEHGDGQARADLLEIMFGEKMMKAFHEFKEIWDPDWRMNPGKVIDSYGQLSNLRLGTDYAPPELDTHFNFIADDNQGSFSRTTLRCVGVGECRRNEGGTMCPSYMATKEEKHSTRGRSRLLFEMLQGDIIDDGWKDESVKEALDLCLACKGCKNDCPMNVDMATYKSEFMSHYYEGRLRPPTAYAFGNVYEVSRAASKMPKVANFFTQTKGLSDAVKFVTGISPERPIPKFANQTFKSWYKKNRNYRVAEEKPKVILWPDTFNNHFKPNTLKAGLNVLEQSGFRVIIPKIHLCCGRPLYDFGWIERAKTRLAQIIDALRPQIRAGIPLVGLEPSCISVFRDEMKDLFHNNEDAKRLAEQTFTLAEFLVNSADSFEPPELPKKALLHAHCHHKSIMGTKDDQTLLAKMKVDFKLLESGCCGMAGFFGYEKGRPYEVSVKSGERVLLPAVREADDDTLVITNGYSCREQIEQLSNRKGMHLAEVIQMAFEKSAPNEKIAAE